MKIRIMVLALVASMISGCVSVPELNEGFRRIDRAWQLEYQKTEDLYRYRVVDAPYKAVYAQVKKTFLDLGMPIQASNLKKGIVIAENEAPHPLTKAEWKKVVEVEAPRVKKVGGWMFKLSEDAEGYIVTVSAGMRAIGNKTFVLLDYSLDMPKYRAMGLSPSEHAPPLAVQIGAIKFWKQLQSNLTKVSLPSPRKRKPEEKFAKMPNKKIKPLTIVRWDAADAAPLI